MTYCQSQYCFIAGVLGRGTLIHFNTQVQDFAARFKGVSKDSLESRDLQDWEVVKRRSKLVLKFDIHLRVEKTLITVNNHFVYQFKQYLFLCLWYILKERNQKELRWISERIKTFLDKIWVHAIFTRFIYLSLSFFFYLFTIFLAWTKLLLHSSLHCNLGWNV